MSRKQQCKVGNTLKVRNREYEVLEVLPRKFREHDLILCIDLRNGTRECFQRFDVDENVAICRTVYSDEYKEFIIAEHKKGTRGSDIARMLFKREDNIKPLPALQSYVSNYIARHIKGGTNEKFKT